MVQAFFVLRSAFSLWMLVDAVQRGAARYWYPIILLPFGEVAYFVSVKVHDPEFRAWRQVWNRLFNPKVTLEGLRYQATETPSFANKLALAQGLFDASLYEEATDAFQALLERDAENKDALYGFAMCKLEVEDYPNAIEALRCLIEIKPSFRDYEGFSHLAGALRETERMDDALVLLEDLVRKAPRLSHRFLYAQYLGYNQQRDKAREQLELGLTAYAHAPRFQQRQERAAATSARAMLAQIDGKKR